MSYPPGPSGNGPRKRKMGSAPSKKTTNKKPRTDNVVDNSLSNLQDSLLSSLECPICMETMKSPILQCSSGHSFCSPCIKRVTHCPICQASVRNPVRNFNLEKLGEQVTYPCPNKKHGCINQACKLSEQQPKRCVVREFDCPISQSMNTKCAWKGQRAQIVAHVKQAHPRAYYNIESQKCGFTYAFNKEYVHEVKLVQFKEDLFLSYDHYEKWQGKCWKAVQYLGPCENASKFVYQITFALPDNSRKIVYTRKVHREDDNIQILFVTDDCFTITEPQIKLFKVGNGKHKLHNSWTILRV